MSIEDTESKSQRGTESRTHTMPARQVSYNSTANLGLLPGSDPFPIDVPQPKKSSENVEKGIKGVASNE